jgi:hypothetical protein
LEHCREEINAAGRARVGNPAPGSTFQYMGRTYRFGDKVPELYPDARMDVYDPGYRGHAKGGIVTKAHLAWSAKPAPRQSFHYQKPAGLGITSRSIISL